MRRLLITLLLVGICGLAWAFDFSVPMQGYSLYFSVVDNEDNVVELVAPLGSGTYRWTGMQPPTGVLDIPAEVEDYDGTAYRVVGIGERALSGCKGITAVNMPPTLTDIGAYAFAQCTGLRGILTIGEGIINIGRGAFFGCTGITEVRFNAVACESMGGSRSSMAFGNCRSLTKVTFGPKVRFIPDYAFVGLESLKCNCVLPASLEGVGEYAFAYCDGLRGALVLPAGVKTVGPYAFAQCHSLTSIEIPSRIERIDSRAFYQCVGVGHVTVKAIVPPSVGSGILEGVPAKAEVRVPCISVERYKAVDEWRSSRRKITALQPCTIDVVARPSDSEGGTVMGAGTHKVGDSVTLVAVCYAGYGFKGWTDGNTDNPRRIKVDDTTSYTAIMVEADVVHEVEYVHDTTYMDGIEVIYEYYEINDVAVPLSSQKEVVYNSAKRRIEVPIGKKEIVDLALYDAAGQCLFTGMPRHGHVNMRRFPTGYYVIRVSTIDDEQALRFFHNRNK